MDELTTARVLIRDAGAEFADQPAVADRLASIAARLDQPPRVALAGTLKAGKSTLLNALVGEEIAPTDATECTTVLTWFERSATPRVEVVERDGRRTGLPVRRTDGRLVLDLGGVAPAEVRRLTVGWPSSLLDRYTLIDTPGTSSNSHDVSARTEEFLFPAGPGDPPCPADAIVYLMRSRHDCDVELLDRLRDRSDGGGPLGVIGVLSRADETTVNGPDRADPTASPGGMDSARAAAARLRGDPELAGVHRDFIAVSGLLALRGRTLREREFRLLATLAGWPDEARRAALLSPGRLAGIEGLGAGRAEREWLLDRFGLIGIRTAVELVRLGARDAPALADALLAHSGLEQLRDALRTRIGGRHGQLKAHTAVRELRAALRNQPARRASRLLRAADRLLADPHPLTELRVLARLAVLPLPEPTRAALDRVLGGAGTAPTTRLGLPPDVRPHHLRTAAGAALAHWHRQLDEPLLDPGTALAYRAAVRSCEVLIAREWQWSS
ncbi:MAG TPA: dynamin family protein [Pseudonocardia sp.]|jgi:hypothetical protein